MDNRVLGALKRIVEEVKEKRRYDCFNKNCVCNHMIWGNDIEIIEEWINGGLK
jgi:hypothetical protein